MDIRGNMRFIRCPPSLECLALVKTATSLWGKDIAEAIDVNQITHGRRNMDDNLSRGFYEIIDGCVLENVTNLSLPKLLKEKLSAFIRPIADEICYWRQYDNLNSCTELYHQMFKNVCWTPEATIDRVKTFQAIVKDNNIDVILRYGFACENCLESDIKALWDQIPEKDFINILYEPGSTGYSSNREGLIDFWSSNMKGNALGSEGGVAANEDDVEEMPVCNYSVFSLMYAATPGNTSAVKYFAQNLPLDVKKECLVGLAKIVASKFLCLESHVPNRYYVDILCFLLSLLEEEQQREAITGSIYPVLLSFLEWPYQKFVVCAANLMWSDLKERLFNNVLYEVVEKIEVGYKDYDYRNLFGEFWIQSPATHKNYVIDLKWSKESVLSGLLKIADSKNISRILKYATVEQKINMIMDHSENCICQRLLEKDVINHFKALVQECIKTDSEMHNLKNGIKTHFLSIFPGESVLLDTFLDFIGDFKENNEGDEMES